VSSSFKASLLEHLVGLHGNLREFVRVYVGLQQNDPPLDDISQGLVGDSVFVWFFNHKNWMMIRADGFSSGGCAKKKYTDDENFRVDKM
jgi:hypothetical protein